VSLLFNGSDISSANQVIFNGASMQEVIFNGSMLWHKNITTNVSQSGLSPASSEEGAGYYSGQHGTYYRRFAHSLRLKGPTDGGSGTRIPYTGTHTFNVSMSAYLDYGFRLYMRVNGGSWIYKGGIYHGDGGQGSVSGSFSFTHDVATSDNIEFSHSAGGYWQNYYSSGSVSIGVTG